MIRVVCPSLRVQSTCDLPCFKGTLEQYPDTEFERGRTCCRQNIALPRNQTCGFVRDGNFETLEIALDCDDVRRVGSVSFSNFNRSGSRSCGRLRLGSVPRHQFSSSSLTTTSTLPCARVYRGRVHSRGRVS
jgi:hypothetical protein